MNITSKTLSIILLGSISSLITIPTSVEAQQATVFLPTGLASLGTIAGNSLVGNTGNTTAAVTAVTLPNCLGNTSALQYGNGTSITCGNITGSGGSFTTANVLGTANQITATISGGNVTLSTPTIFTAPGSIASTGQNITTGNDFAITRNSYINWSGADQITATSGLNLDYFSFFSNSFTNAFRLAATSARQMQLGGEDIAAPGNQTFSILSVVGGTGNTTGANYFMDLSRGTGTGLGGNLTINCAPHGSAGTSQNAYSSCFTINGDTGAAVHSGTLTVNTIGNSTGDFVCAPIGGGLLSEGVTTCVASDKRVKNDLGVITPTEAIVRIMALPQEHRFTYKSGYGPSGDHTGWWAQDIQKVWPGVVYKTKVTPLTPDGELVFDRGEIGPDTTTAVKFLITENTKLKTELETQEKRLTTLEHELNPEFKPNTLTHRP